MGLLQNLKKFAMPLIFRLYTKRRLIFYYKGAYAAPAFHPPFYYADALRRLPCHCVALAKTEPPQGDIHPRLVTA